MASRASVRHAVVAAAVASTVAGCSLLVDSGGLSGTDAPVVDGGTSPADVALDAPTTSADAGSDAAPSDPSLIGEWLFDDIGATLSADTSGQGRAALLKAAAKVTTGGVRGGALAVAGGLDQAVVPGLAAQSFPTTGTLSVWVRYTFNPADGENRAVFDAWDANREHLFLRRANDTPSPKELQFALQDLKAGYVADAYFTLEPSTWAHVVMTWDAVRQQIVCFVDKREIGRRSYGRAFLPRTQDFVLGNNWVGLLDEVRLWNRALDPTEVAVLD